jgi:hypothetical protein
MSNTLKTVVFIVLGALVILGLPLLKGCKQKLVRSYGASSTVYLKRGEHLVNVTWKDSSLWTLTRPLHQGEEPTTYTFKEESVYGVLEGEVTLVEAK